MADTTPEPVPLPGHDRLNGWKEIAAFLGKGVRTAQRWERQYGLPVHRLGHEGGEIVFAFKSEVDQWSLAQDGRGAAAEIDPDDGPNHVPADPPPAARASRWRWPAVAALVVAAAVGGWLIARALPARPGQPASWKVKGDTLGVFDDRGALLWSHRFETLLGEPAYAAQRRAPGFPPVAIQDLDGDGRAEVLIALKPLNQYSERGQGLVCFDADGTVRFAVEPAGQVRFGTTTYSGPWLSYQFFLSRAADGTTTIWAVFIHGMEFPSKLVELDAHGAEISSVLERWLRGFREPRPVARPRRRPRRRDEQRDARREPRDLRGRACPWVCAVDEAGIPLRVVRGGRTRSVSGLSQTRPRP